MSLFGIGGVFNVFELPIVSQFSIALGLQADWEYVDDVIEEAKKEGRGYEESLRTEKRYAGQDKNSSFQLSLINFMETPAAIAYHAQKHLSVGTPIRFMTAQGILRHWVLSGRGSSERHLAQLRNIGCTEEQIIDLLLDFVDNTDFEKYPLTWQDYTDGLNHQRIGAQMFLEVISGLEGGKDRLADYLQVTSPELPRRRQEVSEALMI